MTDIEIPLGKRTRQYRFFEILPGVLSYAMILAPFILSLFNALWAAIFVILYIITYFVRSVAMAIRVIQGYDTLKKTQKLDWASMLADLEHPKQALETMQHYRKGAMARHRQSVEQLSVTTNPRKPSELYNAVIIATYNESRDVLEPTIQSVIASDYDMKHVILVIAYEERGGEVIEQTVKDLHKQYGQHFFTMLTVKHPGDLPNEVPGKGANITYAGIELQKQLSEMDINPDDVIVTTLDSDNRPHAKYFSYLTYEYILHPDPRHAAFQPLALFLNNIWDVPAAMRVVATGNSFWNLVNSLRPHMLRNFASHSQGMAALIDMNFWSTRTIVEDGHQFWRSYFRFDGVYEVVPLYLPIYQDAVLSDTYVKTLKAQFVQVRRWAYGASDIPYVAKQLLRKDRTVPFFDGWAKFVRLLDSHVSWASASFIITLGAFGPLLLNQESSRNILAHELPSTISQVQQIAMIGLFVTIFVSFKLLPPRPERYKRHRNIFLVVQWVLMPITSLVYGASSALNAQTRLMLGKYLDKFDVTEKAVVSRDGKASS